MAKKFLVTSDGETDLSDLVDDVDALSTSIDSHTSNTSNPHSTNKTQVGLGNVPNVDATDPANITQSASYRFATDTEKSTWSGKQDALGYTPENTTNKEMSALDTSTTKYPCNAVVKSANDAKLNIVSAFTTVDHSASGAVSIDCNNQIYYITASANITSFTLSNRPAAGYIAFVIIRAVNWGAYTITFSDGTTAFKWDSNVLPNLTASGQDEIILEITSVEVAVKLTGKDLRNA